MPIDPVCGMDVDPAGRPAIQSNKEPGNVDLVFLWVKRIND